MLEVDRHCTSCDWPMGPWQASVALPIVASVYVAVFTRGIDSRRAGTGGRGGAGEDAGAVGKGRARCGAVFIWSRNAVGSAKSGLRRAGTSTVNRSGDNSDARLGCLWCLDRAVYRRSVSNTGPAAIAANLSRPEEATARRRSPWLVQPRMHSKHPLRYGFAALIIVSIFIGISLAGLN